MYVCMMEYRIAGEQRTEYLRWAEQMMQSFPGTIIYEGIDQSGLFVEIWTAETAEQAQQIQDAARSGGAPWNELPKWIGGSKVNAWSFRQLSR
ncbi:hypothetical protein [Paenibacillus sp. 1P07SE]|uniref:hypothetical protein n=1 Tax=Paenibacillus sp. 1P07SE TaxID=3132209 RepID=UPI0039A446A0